MYNATFSSVIFFRSLPHPLIQANNLYNLFSFPPVVFTRQNRNAFINTRHIPAEKHKKKDKRKQYFINQDETIILTPNQLRSKAEIEAKDKNKSAFVKTEKAHRQKKKKKTTTRKEQKQKNSILIKTKKINDEKP